MFYLVTVDATLRYAMHLKSNLNVYKAYEGPGVREGKPVMLLSYYTLATPEPFLRDTIHSFTDEEFRISRKYGGAQLAAQYIEVLQEEARFDREWRAMWDPRKDHVRRALFAFFRGQLIDTLEQVYMLFRTWWLAHLSEPY